MTLAGKGGGVRRAGADGATDAASLRAATIKDVAREAGVSIGSVSKVLNGAKGVKASTFQKVQAAMRLLNYHPNAAARSMRTQSSKMIGCMVSAIDNPIASQMIQGAETVLREAGFALLLAANHHNPDYEDEILRVFKSRRAEGAILTIDNDESAETRARLKELDIPTVLWERDAGEDYDAALTDQAQGVELATRHLAGLGHRRIGLIAGFRDTWTGREQVKGYLKALSEMGVAHDADLVHNTEDFELGLIYSFFHLHDPPTALIVNIHDAAETMRAARKLNKVAPRDFSLISIGDAKELEVFAPSVTAVRGDGRAIGVAAARLILKRLHVSSGDVPRRVVAPMELIIRDSTARAEPKAAAR